MEAREDPNHGLKSLPGNIASSVKAKATAYYQKLSDKYGPAHAKAIVAVAAITFPLPGGMLGGLAACGLASLSNKIIGKRMSTRANTKHKDDGTFDQTDGNKAHSNNLARCAAVLDTMRPKTKQQVTSLADAIYGRIQQPFDAKTVLGVAIASMPKPISTVHVLAAGALAHLATKVMP